MEGPGPRHLRRRFAVEVMLPIGLLLGLTLAVLLGVTTWTALDQNRYAFETSRRLARGALTLASDVIARGIVDYAVWDEAAVKLVLAPDEAWADENVPFLQETFGADLSFVVDGADRTVHGSVALVRDPRPAEAVLGGGLALLVQAARDQPGRSVSGLLDMEGVPALAVAATVLPHSPAVRLPPGPASVWIAADRLDDARLKELGQTYLLQRLHFVPMAAGAAEPGLTLKTLDGSPLGSIAWQPDRPGSALLHRLLPVLGVLTLGLIGTAALILHQARRAALLIRASEERAFTEPLTGLPNRLLLRDRIELELARQRRDGGAPAVLYLDLDRFKPVNDTHGHAVGDEVLRQVAQRLRTCVRETDTLARLGGDEFVILVAEARTAAAAIRCAERARAAMAPPFQVGDLVLTVGVSIGIALAGAGRPDPDALLRAADRALYLAKRSGRGSWHLAEDLESSGPLVPGSGIVGESPQPVVV